MEHKMTKTTAIAISGLVCILAVSGCTNITAKQKNPVVTASNKVNMISYQVKPTAFNIEIQGVGYLIPSKTTSLYYNNLSGTLKRLYVKENDQVKVGQPIIEIKPLDLEKKMADQEITMKKWDIRNNQLSAEMKSSKASMDLANLNLMNAKKDKTASANFINQLKLQYDIASSTYMSAKWNMELALIDNEKDKKTMTDLKALKDQIILKSPINGIAVNVENLSDNDMVSSGLVIARIAEFGNLVFRFNSSDCEYVKGLNNGKLTVQKKVYNVTIYAPQPGDQISRDFNDQNEKNFIYLKFNGRKLPPIHMNELVNATLDITNNASIVLPNEALYQEEGKNMVDVQYGNEIKSIEVTRGLQTEDKVEIVAGLKSGDKVMIR